MYRIYIITVVLLLNSNIFAQYSYKKYNIKTDSLVCLQDVSVYREFERQGLHDYAVKSWIKAYKSCNGTKKIIYQDGVKFLKKSIKSEKNKVVRNMLIDSMMSIYNQRVKYFAQAAFVKGRQGVDLLNSDRNRADEAYKLLKSSLLELQEKSDPAVIAHYMLASQILHKTNKISNNEVIDNYIKCVELLEVQIKNAEKLKISVVGNKKMLKIVDKIFAKTKINDCGNIDYIFKNKDFSNKDEIYLKKFKRLLNIANCTESEYYFKIMLELQLLNPSVKTAVELSRVFIKRKDYSKAMHYLQDAIDLSNDYKIKSKYHNETAKIRCFKLNEYQKAKNDVLKSLRYQPNNAEAYMLLGDIYALASSNFANDKFGKAAVLWAAIDKYETAKSLNKNLTVKANQKIAYYKKFMPSKEETFMQGYKNGDEYHIKSWINEKIVIRFL